MKDGLFNIQTFSYAMIICEAQRAQTDIGKESSDVVIPEDHQQGVTVSTGSTSVPICVGGSTPNLSPLEQGGAHSVALITDTMANGNGDIDIDAFYLERLLDEALIAIDAIGSSPNLCNEDWAITDEFRELENTCWIEVCAALAKGRINTSCRKRHRWRRAGLRLATARQELAAKLTAELEAKAWEAVREMFAFEEDVATVGEEEQCGRVRCERRRNANRSARRKLTKGLKPGEPIPDPVRRSPGFKDCVFHPGSSDDDDSDVGWVYMSDWRASDFFCQDGVNLDEISLDSTGRPADDRYAVYGVDFSIGSDGWVTKYYGSYNEHRPPLPRPMVVPAQEQKPPRDKLSALKVIAWDLIVNKTPTTNKALKRAGVRTQKERAKRRAQRRRRRARRAREKVFCDGYAVRAYGWCWLSVANIEVEGRVVQEFMPIERVKVQDVKAVHWLNYWSVGFYRTRGGMRPLIHVAPGELPMDQYEYFKMIGVVLGATLHSCDSMRYLRTDEELDSGWVVTPEHVLTLLKYDPSDRTFPLEDAWFVPWDDTSVMMRLVDSMHGGCAWEFTNASDTADFQWSTELCMTPANGRIAKLSHIGYVVSHNGTRYADLHHVTKGGIASVTMLWEDPFVIAGVWDDCSVADLRDASSASIWARLLHWLSWWWEFQVAAPLRPFCQFSLLGWLWVMSLVNAYAYMFHPWVAASHAHWRNGGPVHFLSCIPGLCYLKLQREWRWLGFFPRLDAVLGSLDDGDNFALDHVLLLQPYNPGLLHVSFVRGVGVSFLRPYLDMHKAGNSKNVDIRVGARGDSPTWLLFLCFLTVVTLLEGLGHTLAVLAAFAYGGLLGPLVAGTNGYCYLSGTHWPLAYKLGPFARVGEFLPYFDRDGTYTLTHYPGSWHLEAGGNLTLEAARALLRAADPNEVIGGVPHAQAGLAALFRCAQRAQYPLTTVAVLLALVPVLWLNWCYSWVRWVFLVFAFLRWLRHTSFFVGEQERRIFLTFGTYGDHRRVRDIVAYLNDTNFPCEQVELATIPPELMVRFDGKQERHVIAPLLEKLQAIVSKFDARHVTLFVPVGIMPYVVVRYAKVVDFDLSLPQSGLRSWKLFDESIALFDLLNRGYAYYRTAFPAKLNLSPSKYGMPYIHECETPSVLRQRWEPSSDCVPRTAVVMGSSSLTPDQALREFWALAPPTFQHCNQKAVAQGLKDAVVLRDYNPTVFESFDLVITHGGVSTTSAIVTYGAYPCVLSRELDRDYDLDVVGEFTWSGGSPHRVFLPLVYMFDLSAALTVYWRCMLSSDWKSALIWFAFDLLIRPLLVCFNLAVLIGGHLVNAMNTTPALVKLCLIYGAEFIRKLLRGCCNVDSVAEFVVDGAVDLYDLASEPTTGVLCCCLYHKGPIAHMVAKKMGWLRQKCERFLALHGIHLISRLTKKEGMIYLEWVKMVDNGFPVFHAQLRTVTPEGEDTIVGLTNEQGLGVGFEEKRVSVADHVIFGMNTDIPNEFLPAFHQYLKNAFEAKRYGLTINCQTVLMPLLFKRCKDTPIPLALALVFTLGITSVLVLWMVALVVAIVGFCQGQGFTLDLRAAVYAAHAFGAPGRDQSLFEFFFGSTFSNFLADDMLMIREGMNVVRDTVLPVSEKAVRASCVLDPNAPHRLRCLVAKHFPNYETRRYGRRSIRLAKHEVSWFSNKTTAQDFAVALYFKPGATVYVYAGKELRCVRQAGLEVYYCDSLPSLDKDRWLVQSGGSGLTLKLGEVVEELPHIILDGTAIVIGGKRHQLGSDSERIVGSGGNFARLIRQDVKKVMRTVEKRVKAFFNDPRQIAKLPLAEGGEVKVARGPALKFAIESECRRVRGVLLHPNPRFISIEADEILAKQVARLNKHLSEDLEIQSTARFIKRNPYVDAIPLTAFRGAASGIDGQSVATVETMHYSLSRYIATSTNSHMLIEDARTIAKSLVTGNEDLFCGSRIADPTILVSRWLRLKDYSAGFPFIATKYKDQRVLKRADVRKLGLKFCLATAALDNIESGLYYPSIAHAFPKSQVVKRAQLLANPHKLRTIVATSVLDNLMQQVFYYDVNNRHRLSSHSKVGIRQNGRILGKVFEAASNYKFSYSLDMTAFDANIKKLVFDVLQEMRKIGFEESPAYETICKHIDCLMQQTQQSRVVNLISETMDELVGDTPVLADFLNDMSPETAEAFAEFLLHHDFQKSDLFPGGVVNKNQGGATGDSNTTFTNTIGLAIVLYSALAELRNCSVKEVVSSVFLQNVGDDNVLSTNERIDTEELIRVVKARFGLTLKIEGSGEHILDQTFLAKAPRDSVEFSEEFALAGVERPRFAVVHDRERLMLRYNEVPIHALRNFSNTNRSLDYLFARGMGYLSLTAHHRELFEHIHSDLVLVRSKMPNKMRNARKYQIPSYNTVLRKWYEPGDHSNFEELNLLNIHVNAFYKLEDNVTKLLQVVDTGLNRLPGGFKPREMEQTFDVPFESDFTFERHIFLSLAEDGVVDRGTFQQACSRSPFSSFMEPFRFINHEAPLIPLDGEYFVFARRQALWRVLIYTTLYVGVHGSLTQLPKLPFGSAILKLVNICTLSLPRCAHILNHLVYLATGSGSPEIAGVIPKDPYHYHKYAALLLLDLVPDISVLSAFPVEVLTEAVNWAVKSYARLMFPVVEIPLLQNGTLETSAWDATARWCVENLNNGESCVVSAPTAAGKTKNLPPALVRLTGRRVCVVLPRVILCEGQAVYGILHKKQGVTEVADLMTCTNGYLTATFESGEPDWAKGTIFVFDEAHEESPEWIYFWESWLGNRPGVLLTATPTRRMQNLQHKVVDCVAPFSVTKEVYPESEFDNLVGEKCATESRVLVIVQSKRAAESLCRRIRTKTPCTVIHGKKRTVANEGHIVATSIVDAGITIKGVTCVIDCSTRLVNDGGTLKRVPIDAATQIQRAGRTGRVCNGTYWYCKVPEETPYKIVPSVSTCLSMPPIALHFKIGEQVERNTGPCEDSLPNNLFAFLSRPCFDETTRKVLSLSCFLLADQGSLDKMLSAYNDAKLNNFADLEFLLKTLDVTPKQLPLTRELRTMHEYYGPFYRSLGSGTSRLLCLEDTVLKLAMEGLSSY